MSKIVRVNKNDKYRVLLTELLPYEVPLIFSNEGFYEFMKIEYSKKKHPQIVEEFLFGSKNNIPFCYKIKKNSIKHRTLSIMHTNSQRSFIDFYNKYDSLIIHLCNRSPISLRHPSQVASVFFTKDVAEHSDTSKEEELETEGELLDNPDHGQPYCSSYFKYKKYDFLHKFYDSYEFLRIEKRFRLLIKFDISNCFQSIYTHSISWAIKGKRFAKEFRNRESFETKFDDLMQQSNYRETNGVLIGPEISRIFAEIILQTIETNAFKALEEKGLKLKHHYDMRRYVDDYFLFVNDDKVGAVILKTFESELEQYKLYLNHNKTEKSAIPFISGITVGRNEVIKLLNDLFLKFETQLLGINSDEEFQEFVEKKIFKIKSPYKISKRLITDVKCIIKNNNIDYETISRITLSIVKRRLNKIYKRIGDKKLDEQEIETFSHILLALYDFLFFLYSMDSCVRITYVMSQIIVATNNFFADKPDEYQHLLKKKVYDESIFLIKNLKSEEKYLSIEVLNLLLALKELGKEYHLSEELLLDLTKMDLVKGELCYFHMIVVLYYIDKNSLYNNIRNRIELYIIEYFRKEIAPNEKAELVCLFFDVNRCPYVSEDCKNQIIEISYQKIKGKNISEEDRNCIRNYISERDWFVKWDESINLDFILSKKELSTPY